MVVHHSYKMERSRFKSFTRYTLCFFGMEYFGTLVHVFRGRGCFGFVFLSSDFFSVGVHAVVELP